jgi:hypothetical protein
LNDCDIIEITIITDKSNIDYKDQLEKANGTIAVLQQELAQLKKLIFGSRQERFVPATSGGQLSLDMISEPVATLEVSKSRKIEYTRSSITAKPVNHPGRTKLPEHLRREEIVLEPDHLPAGSKRLVRKKPSNWNVYRLNYM